MFPYYTLIGVPALFAMWENDRYKDQLGKKRAITAFFVIWFVLLACRDISCGVDLSSYAHYFKQAQRYSWSAIWERYDEPLYFLYCKAVALIRNDFQFFLAITAMIITGSFMWFYKKESVMPYLTVILFATVVPFNMFFSGLRQAIAMTFVVPAWYCTKNKKLLRFILWVALASLFHRSAWVLLVIYPLYRAKITKKWLWFVIPASGIMWIYHRQIFSLLLRFFGNQYAEKYSETSSGSAYTMLVLFVLFAIFAFVIPDEKKMNRDTIAMRNILLLIVFIQMFASVHELAMRMNYYFLPFIPIVIPGVIKAAGERYRQVAFAAQIVLTLFFIVYFFYNAYTGEDMLEIYPYVPFWKG